MFLVSCKRGTEIYQHRRHTTTIKLYLLCLSGEILTHLLYGISRKAHFWPPHSPTQTLLFLLISRLCVKGSGGNLHSKHCDSCPRSTIPLVFFSLGLTVARRVNLKQSCFSSLLSVSGVGPPAACRGAEAEGSLCWQKEGAGGASQCSSCCSNPTELRQQGKTQADVSRPLRCCRSAEGHTCPCFPFFRCSS